MIKKLTVLFCFLFIYSENFAQNWASGIDDSNFSGGFILLYTSAEYKILKISNWRNSFYDSANGNILITPNLKSISSLPAGGFGIGGLVNKNISDNFDVRLSPTFLFSDRVVRYEYEPLPPVDLGNGQTKSFQSSIDKKIQSTMFEFPLGLKVKSNRMNNFRAYWLVGMKYSMDIASKKKTFDEGETPINKLLKSQRSYLSYETGIGFDLYFEYFKMSPEIKLSYSTSDLLQHDDTAFANPIDKLMLRQLTFSLIFQ